MDSTGQPVEGGLRQQLAPHAAVGALVVAAAAARVAVHVTGDEQVVATWVAGAAFVVGVVAATRLRRRPLDKKSRRRALAFIGVAAGWLTAVTVTGLSLGAVGVLMALGYGLSLHWWRQHPVGLIQPKSEYQRLWAENNGASDGALPGSRLTKPEPIKAGIRYALKLRAGKQTLEQAVAAIGRLRGGLHLLPDQQMLLEPHPTEPEPTLLLTIVTKSPIKQAVDWPGPEAFDPATGRVRLGPYADGEGVATWRAYTDNRLWGGFIQGGSGSGKSRLIESIAFSLAAAESHPTVIWYGDGQRGASSPLLMKHADLFAGTYDQIEAMLVGMELLMVLRQQENVERELEGFAPIEDRPGVLGVIDECHKVFDKEQNVRSARTCQRIAATIAREGGKVGVNLLLASQEPTLGAFGGAGNNDAEVLRSNLLSGNGVMLAGSDPNAKTIFGVEDNPKKFPRYGGYGMVTTPAPGERQAHFRGYYLNDKLRAYWPGRIVWRCLSAPEGYVALGRDYGTRARSYADRKASLSAPRRTVERGAAEPQPAAGGDGAALEAFGAVAFPPSWETFVAQAQQEARKELGPSHAKVLDAIAAGHTSPQRIADEIGLSVRQVHNLLGTLMEAGRVRGGGRRYEVAEAA
ncbi:hypothetical protein [Micromonospora sp. C41]|uniref:hypothetical protein n=1 Tax=Micromonospora sp. C41 TaxID=2824878 RepID=UPI001B378AB0|nr:hypothetical protein [Micromonospora sp. C41]MBQ1064455.1 hypothetical protein [Micromonospora sp. C41]